MLELIFYLFGTIIMIGLLSGLVFTIFFCVLRPIGKAIKILRGKDNWITKISENWDECDKGNINDW